MAHVESGVLTAADYYPEIPIGSPVAQGGPGPMTLAHELEHMAEKLKNINDEDLYRVYHERWVNPDRNKPGWKTLKPDAIPYGSMRLSTIQTHLKAGSRAKTLGQKEAVAEYVRDRDALERERLLHYMIDPELELLEDEAILGALFPDVEAAQHPAFEMYKYKIKIEELHPYTYSIWDNVKGFYYREDKISEMHKLEVDPVGGLPYADPIAAYNALYEPVNELVRTVAARTGDFMHHGNVDHEIDEMGVDLYDQDKAIEESVHRTEDFDEFKTAPTNFFYQYAKAMLKKSKDGGEKYQTDVDYWSEITRPFEYEPREAPLDRPLFIELPNVKLKRLGEGTWNNGNRILLPKLSSKVVFDYISYTPNNPTAIIDSTYRIGEPISIRWGRDELPKCLAMSVNLYPQGSRFEVTCPPRLLFGYNGWPERGYPANSEITFDIEIREVGAPTPMHSSTVFYQDHDNPNSKW